MAVTAVVVGVGVSHASEVATASASEINDGVILYDAETGEPFKNSRAALPHAFAAAADQGYHVTTGVEAHAYRFTVKLVNSDRVESYRSVIQQVADELRASGHADITVAPGVIEEVGSWISDNEIFFATTPTTPCGASDIACAAPYLYYRADYSTAISMRGKIWVAPYVDNLVPHKRYEVVAHEIGHVLGLDHYDSLFEGVPQVMNSSSSKASDNYQKGDRAGLTFVGRDAKPVGMVDPVTASAGKARVSGWAFDPDLITPATVRVTVNGKTVSEKATDVSRSDVHASNPTLETKYNYPRGFDVTVDAAEGARVCVSVLNYPRTDFSQVGSCQNVGLTTDRIQGSDRFESAVAVARAAYPGTAPIVLVASSQTFPDALSAGPAASKLGGPLLLTQGTALPAATKAEITRLKPSKILVVGGPAAVSTAVEAELKKLASSVVRVSGSDRYETSRAMAKYAFSSASIAFVASGDVFPDALAVGAAAAATQAPMLLVSGGPSATDKPTADQIKALGATSVRVAGGTAAVAEATVNTIKASIADTRRVSGADRFVTAAEVSKSVFSPTTTQAYIVNGLNFPDGLVAAPLAGKTKSPVYLSPGGCVPREVLTDLARLGVTKLTLVGGTTVLTGAVAALNTCA